MIQTLNSQSPDFNQALTCLLRYDSGDDSQVEQQVREIIKAIREDGDLALMALTNRFDERSVSDIQRLELSQAELKQALDRLTAEEREALEFSITRVREYHEHQKDQSWHYVDAEGTQLGQKITALERVGLYVPGGKAVYPSSVIMNAIPAKVAGVSEIIMVVPAPRGETSDWVLGAAYLAGVDRVFTVGGAQAIAALAYGTGTIPRVDKIVGPGNIYVATAKKQVFGQVGIDMIAGPSEVVIVSDGTTSPDWLAMDLFAQAEHDEQAQAILISPSQKALDDVAAAIQMRLPEMSRKAVIEVALKRRGAFIKVADMSQAFEVVNQIAPEHLELSMQNAEAYLDRVHHAGAIFLGAYTAESLGDYCAGPNHVLPTAGTARFSSPLGVYDFQKRSSVIRCTPTSSQALARNAAVLALGEGLEAHARAAQMRLSDDD